MPKLLEREALVVVEMPQKQVGEHLRKVETSTQAVVVVD